MEERLPLLLALELRVALAEGEALALVEVLHDSDGVSVGLLEEGALDAEVLEVRVATADRDGDTDRDTVATGDPPLPPPPPPPFPFFVADAVRESACVRLELRVSVGV